MNTKRITTVSGFKDYVKVDTWEVDENGNQMQVIENHLYLKRNKLTHAYTFDFEDKSWLKCALLYDGEKITSEDIDNKSFYYGMIIDVEPNELSDENSYRFILKGVEL